ncbi:MAG: hypothetical protein KDH88_20695 [Chromatiales bacterium]|nr:hypothetical protein [Chromatiales bacterium]
MVAAVVLAALVAIGSITPGPVFSASETEIQVYLTIYAGSDLSAQKEATKSLAWMAMTDRRVNDALERLVVQYHRRGHLDKDQGDAFSWFLKGLGYSGDFRYRATLETVAAETGNGEVRTQARLALQLLAAYANWNPIIDDRRHWNDDQSDRINRFANMVASDVWDLKALAGMRIYEDRIRNAWLLDRVNEEIRAHYRNSNSERSFTSAYSWLTRGLAASGNPKYESTIRAIAANSHNERWGSDAKRYLWEFGYDH